TEPALGSVAERLPKALTSFVGRAREVAAVRDLLSREPTARLVSLTGAPGTGKTRLALEVATVLSGTSVNRVWFVPLSSVPHPALVPFAIAQGLDVIESSNEPVIERLIAFLQSQP